VTPPSELALHELSPYQGYALFFRIAIEWLETAAESPSVDLVTLIVDMEIDAGGRSHDPAMLCEWSNRWGPRAALTSKEAMRVGFQFVEFERGWSEEPTMKRFIEEFRKAGESNYATPLWRAWQKALPEVLSSVEPLQLTSAWLKRNPHWETDGPGETSML
jgi:hypothetical protein